MRVKDWFKKYCKEKGLVYTDDCLDSIEFWLRLSFKMDITEDMKYLNMMKDWSIFNSQAVFMYLVCVDSSIRIAEFKRLALNKKHLKEKYPKFLEKQHEAVEAIRQIENNNLDKNKDE